MATRTYSAEYVMQEFRNHVSIDTQKGFAAKHKFSAQFINDVLAGRRAISVKLASALGFNKLPDTYTRKPKESK